MYYNEDGMLESMSYVQWTRDKAEYKPFVIVPSEEITDEDERLRLLREFGGLLDVVFQDRLDLKYFPVVKHLGGRLYSDDMAFAIRSTNYNVPFYAREKVGNLVDALNRGGVRYRLMDAEYLKEAYTAPKDFVRIITGPESRNYNNDAEIKHLTMKDNPLFGKEFLEYCLKDHPEMTKEKLLAMARDDENRIKARDISAYYYEIKCKYKQTSKMLCAELMTGLEGKALEDLKMSIIKAEMDNEWSLQRAIYYAIDFLDTPSDNMSIEYWYEIEQA